MLSHYILIKLLAKLLTIKTRNNYIFMHQIAYDPNLLQEMHLILKLI